MERANDGNLQSREESSQSTPSSSRTLLGASPPAPAISQYPPSSAPYPHHGKYIYPPKNKLAAAHIQKNQLQHKSIKEEPTLKQYHYM